MSTKTAHLTDLHFEHTVWLNEIRFYTEELDLLRKRLSELAAGNNSPEFRQQLEHFQNQVAIQDEQADILKHDINVHEDGLKAFAATASEIALDHQHFAYHGELAQRINTYKEIYADFKAEFMRFAARWM